MIALRTTDPFIVIARNAIQTPGRGSAVPLGQRSTVHPGRWADGEAPRATGKIPARREDPANLGLERPAMTSAELIRAIGVALFGSRYQQDLGEALGVNRRTVSRWASGEDEPRPGVWPDLLGIMWERRRELGVLIRTVEQHGLG